MSTRSRVACEFSGSVMRVVERVTSGGGHAGRVAGGMIAAPLELIDDLDFDGGLGAGVDAGRLKAVREAAVAHVAFADDAALWVELRDRVGAVPDAVLAADAGVGGVKDDSGDGVFGIGIDRAALDAVGAEAMVAAHREIEALGVRVGAAFDLADAPPADVGGRVVLLVAGDLAGAAADALGHVEVEAVLFAGFERTLRDERGFDVCLRRWQPGRTRGRSPSGARWSSWGRCARVRGVEVPSVPFVDGTVLAWLLVDVAVIAVLVFELLHVLRGRVAAEAGLLFDDGVQRGVDVLGHAGGIAADVDAGAFFKPRIEARGLLEHAVLHVDLAVLIAGEGEVEAGEMAVGVHGLEFVLVEEVGGGAALSEEEPVASGVAEGAALVQEAAEGRDAGAWADHDDWRHLCLSAGEISCSAGCRWAERSPMGTRSASRVEQTPPRSRLCER